MSELMKIVLSLSVSGTLLFLIISALKPLYLHKLSKGWQYYIWLIVIVRMLLPFSTETTLLGSAFQYFDNSYVGRIQTTSSTNETQSDLGAENNYVTSNAKRQDDRPLFSPQAMVLKVYENIWILWAAIAFALWIRKVTMYQSFVRFVKVGWEEVSDIKVLNKLAAVGETMGVKRPVELFNNPLISSPMMLGFLHPYIILPGIEFDNKELTCIFRHELTHHKRLDMFYKWLVQILVCLHWFNPFVYVLAKEINKCCELSCDEAIIRTLNQDEKKAYGDTLLNSLKTRGHYNDKLAAVTLTEEAEQLKERLDAIMKYKKNSKAVIAITLALTSMICIGATTIGAYATPSGRNVLSENKQADKEKTTRQESFALSFAPYQSHGLIYNAERDRVFWNGQEVKAFVDIREMFSGGGYSFNVGYIEPDSKSDLYLMAVRDEKDLLTGIQGMSKELQEDLYGKKDKTSSTEPDISDLEDEIQDSLSEIYGREDYVTFDGTTYLKDSSVTATDNFSDKDIPKTIADWILTCQESDEVNVKRRISKGTLDAWIYVGSDTRKAWNMSTDGTTIKFVLTDKMSQSVSGATIIHYQAPEEYQGLEVYYKSEKLKINVGVN